MVERELTLKVAWELGWRWNTETVLECPGFVWIRIWDPSGNAVHADKYGGRGFRNIPEYAGSTIESQLPEYAADMNDAQMLLLIMNNRADNEAEYGLFYDTANKKWRVDEMIWQHGHVDVFTVSMHDDPCIAICEAFLL